MDVVLQMMIEMGSECSTLDWRRNSLVPLHNDSPWSR